MFYFTYIIIDNQLTDKCLMERFSDRQSVWSLTRGYQGEFWHTESAMHVAKITNDLQKNRSTLYYFATVHPLFLFLNLYWIG